MPISLPADNAAPYTYTQPIRDAITGVNNLLEPTINAQTGTTYTFVLDDASRMVRAGNAGAQTYTIPTNASVAFPIGTELVVIRYGAGPLTIANPGSPTIQTPSSRTARAQYSVITALKIATDEWILGGDLT